MSPPGTGRAWVARDIHRIRQRYGFTGAQLSPAARDYLRAWSLLLLSSDLPMGDEDRERLRCVVRVIDAERERERAA